MPGPAEHPAERDRRLLHADLDAFYASVEQRDDPALAGRPTIVGQGVVLAASYEARGRGVRTAMNGREALRLCPDAVVVPPRMKAYSEASAAVFEVFFDTTPEVEALSIDEAFLDVSGLYRSHGAPVQVAERLRERVRREVGLPLSIGVASTKFLAKVASARAKPNGLLQVPVGGELEFLWPLGVRAIWGVGPATERRLAERGVHTVGELAAVPQRTLQSWIGRAAGAQLHALSHNRDPRPVTRRGRRKSIGAQQALGRSRPGRDEAEVLLTGLAERVTRRLRDGNRTARTVELRWRDLDMATHTSSTTLAHPSDDTGEILAAGRRLLAGAWPRIEPNGLGLIGLTVANLSGSEAVQMGLDFSGRDTSALDSTLDAVTERFGSGAITRGSLLGREVAETPVLPDPPEDT
ncbi:MAG: DNA polymerase IV [Microthrixaceae bacterium]|nr:DNA polymerase IV [Microthrixaceae bacterium]